MFTFLIVIRQNFEYNLRILANFLVKSKKIYGFRPYLFKKLQFLGGFFNKDYTFYTGNLFFTTKDAQGFVKISFFSNMFTFLSVIRQNFEYNLRILANFSVKTQNFQYNLGTLANLAKKMNNLWISPILFKKLQFFFFGFLNKDYIFYAKNLCFTTKDAESFVKISFFSNMFTFLSVIRQNFEYNL